MKTTIVGLGNPILGDDRVGLLIMREVEKLYSTSDKPLGDVVFQEAWQGGLLLLDQIDGFDHAVLIDSIVSGSYEVGTLIALTPEDFRETRHISNLHDINFGTALKLGDKMGHKVPEKLDIFAVEVNVTHNFNDPISPQVEAVIPRAAHEIAKRIFGL